MRKNSDPESWKIARNLKTGELLVFHPSAEPDILGLAMRKTNPEYEILGEFAEKADADFFVQYKELKIPADAAAYIICEREIRRKFESGNSVELQTLQKMVNSTQEETGRTCFGHCQSMVGSKACNTCFVSRKTTWELCTAVKCITELFAQKEQSTD